MNHRTYGCMLDMEIPLHTHTKNLVSQLLNGLRNEEACKLIAADQIFEKQRFTLFRIFSITGALVSFGVYFKMYVMFDSVKPLHLVLPMLSVLMLINFYSVKQLAQLEKAYLIVLLSSFMLLHVVSYSTGGIHSASITYYAVVILTAYMLLGPKGGFMFTALFCFQMFYMFLVTRFTNWTTFEFLNNEEHHVQEDFLFNGLFTSFLIAAQSAYLFSGRNIVIRKITEQRDALEKSNMLLQNTNNELQKANKELDKFVYSVSHDLRAPLSSILGMVQLTEEDVTDEQVKSNLAMVRGSVFKLDAFIQDILDYSRNSRLEVKQDSIQFTRLVNEVTGSLKYMANDNREVNLITEIHQTGHFISDKNRLTVILNNLISNSMRYCRHDTADAFVKIRIDATADSCKIVISDNGMGIRPEFHQRVFEMFFRVSEESVGSGLGLYLVKESVEKLNGTVRLDSVPGTGTSFTIHIPSIQYNN